MNLRKSAGVALLIASTIMMPCLSSAQTSSRLRMALTFDDLPAHGPLPPGETRLDVITTIISALQAERVPAPYGFVNGQLAEQHPEDTAVLQVWRAAGFPLGNHSWSHMNLNQHSLAEFESDVKRNEALLQSLMGNADWHWFRFPYLAEGDTAAKREGVRSYLATGHYQIAAVTMSFGDYQWNEPYARCKQKGDAKAVELLESSYLAAADAAISYYRNMSEQLFGRDIPYVLLMHVGAFDAEMLPKLLRLYRQRGFVFVTLDEAERDEFYRVSTNPGLPFAPDTLEGNMAQRQLQFPAHTVSLPKFETLCTH